MVWWSLFLLLLTTSASTCLQHSHNHVQVLISGPVYWFPFWLVKCLEIPRWDETPLAADVIKNVELLRLAASPDAEKKESAVAWRTSSTHVQGSAKRQSLGLENFVTALTYHFCLALPVEFTQPWDHLLAEPCISTMKSFQNSNWNFTWPRSNILK